MKNKIKNLNVYKLYNLIFIVVFFIVFLPLSIRNFNLGISGLYRDALVQHVLFFYDYISKIKGTLFLGLNFNIFDFNLGLGADTISSYSYYGLFDPLNIIAIILPLKWIEFSYYLTLSIKIYLSGLFFIMFAKKILLKDKWALASTGILYAFNSFFLMLVLKHGIFAGCLMIFPLVLLGTHKILSKEKPYLLIFSTLYAVLSQFYLYAYIALGFEIFALIRTFMNKQHKKDHFINLLKTNLFFTLGTLLGAFVIFSQLYAIINNGRTTGNTMIQYGSGYFATLIFGNLIPTPIMHQSLGIGNFLATILIILYFMKIRKEKWLMIWLLILLPMLLVPIFGYTFSLSTYVTNRWSFIIIVPICLVCGLMIESIKEITKYDLVKALKICCCSFVIGLILLANYLIENFLFLDIIYSLFIRLFISILLVLLYIFIYKCDFHKIKFKEYDSYTFSKDFIKVHIILIFLFNIGTNFMLTDGYIFNNYYKNEFDSSYINDNNFYRVSKNKFIGNLDCYSNDSIYGNYSSTFFYNTVNNGNILDFINYFNVSNENSNVGYNGLGKRYILETISGVKYYVIKDSETSIQPYNFSYHSSYESIKYNQNDFNSMYDKFLKEKNSYVKENNKIYINNNHLPLGFVYDSYVHKNELDNLTPLQRQTYLSKSVILDTDINNIDKSAITIHEPLIKELYYETINTKGIDLSDNKIKVYSKDNFIELKVDNFANSELYLEFLGIKNEKEYSKTVIKYSSDTQEWKETIFYKGENLYVDNYDQLLYMGYSENKETKTLKISFNNPGNYYYDSLNIYSLSMNDIIEDIDKLNNKSLKDIEILGDKIKGNITLNEKGILFLSIPYSNGFKAFVNGKEVKILKANIGYMGLELNSGYNEVVIAYSTPYFNLGLKTAFISVVILAIYSIYDFINYQIKKKKY